MVPLLITGVWVAASGLAGFFRTFRDTLNGLQGDASVRSGSKVGILTPGPMTDTYYEQAYIARYLGIMLLEAFLSFLGLGVQPPMSSWGVLIKDGAEKMEELDRKSVV